jgi:hypothetical protein
LDCVYPPRDIAKRLKSDEKESAYVSSSQPDDETSSDPQSFVIPRLQRDVDEELELNSGNTPKPFESAYVESLLGGAGRLPIFEEQSTSSINLDNPHQFASLDLDQKSSESPGLDQRTANLFFPDELQFTPLSLASQAMLLNLPNERGHSTFSYEFEEKYLYGISYFEAQQLIEVYDCEVNCLYPMFSVGELKDKFENVWRHYSLRGVLNPAYEDDFINVKIVIAIGAAVSSSHLSTAHLLYEDVLSNVERSLISGEGSLNSLVHLLLVHQYQFHRDMGVLAYRTVGFASILALELGLYKTKELEKTYTNLEERERCRVVFWCLYVMDRRLSIYTKRPFILHDEDIDQKMPQSFGAVYMTSASSEDDLFRAMHLNYMIHYSRLSGKVLEALSSKEQVKGFQDNVQYLMYLMEKWRESLPPELKREENLPSQPSPTGSRKLKWMIYLKSNLILLHIYQSCSIDTYIVPAIETACECIRELGRLYFNTDFYSSCEIQYNHFLVAALDVLYSSLRRAPHHLEKCMTDIKLALKIISLIMKRSDDRRQGSIWQLVVSFAFKFGLSSPFGAKLLEGGEYKAAVTREAMLTSMIAELSQTDSGRISEADAIAHHEDGFLVG